MFTLLDGLLRGAPVDEECKRPLVRQPAIGDDESDGCEQLARMEFDLHRSPLGHERTSMPALKNVRLAPQSRHQRREGPLLGGKADVIDRRLEGLFLANSGHSAA